MKYLNISKQQMVGYGAIVMSLLTALAAAPYTLGEVATIIPPDWKAKVFVVSAIATMILRVIRDNTPNAKPPLTTDSSTTTVVSDNSKSSTTTPQ